MLITSEFPPQPGGIGNHAHNLANALLPHNFSVTVLADQRSKDGRKENTFDTAQKYNTVRVQRRSLLLITYLQRIMKAINLAKKNDVVIVSGKFSLWIAGLLRFFYSKQIVAVIHGSEVAIPPSFKKRFTKWCLQRCSNVVAVSNYTKSLVHDWNLKSVVVIPNGFLIDASNEIYNTSVTPIRLITVGNVTQRKGQHNVIKALPLLLERFPKLQYEIVGIPTEKEQVEILAKKLKVQSAVVFRGKVSEEEKIHLLTNATIFVMLSETTATGDVEGFGIAILEANALGVPAIGAKKCGIEDAILDGVSGILVDAHQPEQMLQAVSSVLENYNTYSVACKKWSEKFSWEKISTRYKEVLTS